MDSIRSISLRKTPVQPRAQNRTAPLSPPSHRPRHRSRSRRRRPPAPRGAVRLPQLQAATQLCRGSRPRRHQLHHPLRHRAGPRGARPARPLRRRLSRRPRAREGARRGRRRRREPEVRRVRRQRLRTLLQRRGGR
ncbi:hypothetical protein GQ55_3G274300 [Panicum hallii var. hallii]|uniref:Uncharacterized protein n=1 Tax=Panicum hallii var. hallii TaxID=1504633 RepID=A0A2T7EDY3_9POAL|nr:hypothetical protein GQ55_3G274300 [Panicum hallii var. hallii]